MRTYKKTLLIIIWWCWLCGSFFAFAASTPSLGIAATFGVLSSTYTNTTLSTVINGNLWYTTPPAVNPTVNGTTHVWDAVYNQAGIDQGIALSSLNGEWCTFIFAAWAIDLSTDITHGPVGVYEPGVYCSAGAMDVGGPLVLSGNGTYIFRPGGALTSTVGAAVSLSNASSACDVFWTPGEATTLAANTTFIGTVIDDAGITVWANTTRLGMALSFGETITTDTTTLTVPVCSIVPTTFHIIKQVNGGILPASVFTLHLTFSGIDVLGSPFSGAVFPGAPYTLDTGEYVVSEGLHSGYVQSFSGDCSSSGHVTLYPADDKTCIIINTFIPPVVQISFGGGGGVFPPSMSGTIITINTGITINTITGITVAVPVTGSVTVPQVMVPLAPRLNVSVPLLPDTGVAPQQKDTPWGMIVTISMFIFVSIISFVVVTRKEHI